MSIIWFKRKKNIFTFDDLIDDLTSITFSQDGMLLALGNINGITKVYDIRNPNPLYNIKHSYHLPIKKKLKKGDKKKGGNLPPIKKHEIISFKKIHVKNSSQFKTNSLMSTDNEELIAQIYYSKNEIQQKMKEIKELQSKFSLLEDDNRTNKLLMEKLLYKEEDSPQADDNNQDENIEKKDESPDKNSPRKKNKEEF